MGTLLRYKCETVPDEQGHLAREKAQEKSKRGLKDLHEARRRAGRSRRKGGILAWRCVVSRE
jgi:hypothetical protein